MLILAGCLQGEGCLGPVSDSGKMEGGWREGGKEGVGCGGDLGYYLHELGLQTPSLMLVLRVVFKKNNDNCSQYYSLWLKRWRIW